MIKLLGGLVGVDARKVFSEKKLMRRKKRRKKRRRKRRRGKRRTTRSVQEWSFCECSCSTRNGQVPPG